MSAHPMNWNFNGWILPSFLLDNRFYIGILSRQVYQWLKGKFYHEFWNVKVKSKLKWLGFCMTMNVLFRLARTHISPHIMSATEYLCMIYWNNAKLSVHVYCLSASHPWWVFHMEETQLYSCLWFEFSLSSKQRKSKLKSVICKMLNWRWEEGEKRMLIWNPFVTFIWWMFYDIINFICIYK